MTRTVRPARLDDVRRLMELWRREVAAGRQDIVPNETRFRRLLARFDWDSRSRVVDAGGKLLGSVLVASRPSPDGVLANVYAAGEDAVYAEMARWGVLCARAQGAQVVQLFAGKGRGDGLADAGLRNVRAWWRMDRALDERLPAPPHTAGYGLVDGHAASASWADLFNAAFADHWRFAPRTEAEIVGDRPPELSLMAVTAQTGEPAALALAELEDYAGDPRPQPVGVISSVGTRPAHRRRGLAGWLVAELLLRARRAGARSASLYVDPENHTRAADLYRKLGFEVAYEAEVWEATNP